MWLPKIEEGLRYVRLERPIALAELAEERTMHIARLELRGLLDEGGAAVSSKL